MSTGTSSIREAPAQALARSAGIGGFAHITAYASFLVLAACLALLAIGPRLGGPPPPMPIAPDANMAGGLVAVAVLVVIAGTLLSALVLSALAWLTGVRDWGLVGLALFAIPVIFVYLVGLPIYSGSFGLVVAVGTWLFVGLALLLPICKLVIFFRSSI